MLRNAVATLVFAAAFVYLGTLAQPLGYGYLDPVGKVTAQDESVYAHAALRMARTGDWTTPYFMGRFFLYKPPLVYWTAAAAVERFGASADSLRLPSRLAASLVCALVFLWLSRQGRWFGGLCAAAILALTPLFAQMANRAMTDALLCLFMFGALYLLMKDPRLIRWRSWTGVGIATGLAILTKSTAGLLPLLILGAWWIAGRERPSLVRLVQVGFVALLVAAPWFCWQNHLHPRWFQAEFLQVELLAYGAGAPPQQTAGESGLGFYWARLLATAPVVLFAGAAGLYALSRRVLRRDSAPLLVALALAVSSAAIMAFGYRNLPYLLPLAPLLAVAAGYLPRPLVAVALVVAAVWAGRYTPPQPLEELPVRRALDRRAHLHRPNEVLIVGIPEAFYATTLGLPKLRYALPAAEQPPKGFALDFEKLGIAVPVDVFLNLTPHLGQFRAELRAWGLPNDDAIATVITYRDHEQIGELALKRPDLDIFWPDGRVRWGAGSGEQIAQK